MNSNESTEQSEAARMNVLKKVLEFIKSNNGAPVLEIKLADTDAEAMADGWPSMAAQQISLIETIQALPIDVSPRVKLVAKRWVLFTDREKKIS